MNGSNCKTVRSGSPTDRLLGVSNGVASVQDGDQLRTFAVTEELQSKLSSSHDQENFADADSQANTVGEEQVLNMHINSDKVTIADIDSYEDLMKGSIAAASSNASAQRGQVSQNGFVKHAWKNIK